MEDVVALRIRDQHLIRVAVQTAYTDRSRIAGWAPPKVIVETLVGIAWETRIGSTDREAFGGISQAVTKLLTLLKKAPGLVSKIVEALAIEGWGEMSWLERAKALGQRLKELMAQGKRLLGAALQQASETFPLNLFFVSHSKMPGLTDLMHRLFRDVPWIRKALESVHTGSVKFDVLLKKYLPRLRRPLYAAIFIWVWINVAELSWDLQGILAGFTGQINLSQLLASLPESGLGFVAAVFGLGYGALPYAVIARLVWLVANKYFSYVPGKGLLVQWDKLGVKGERSEWVSV